MTTSESIIEALVTALPENATERDRYFYRETLYALVHLAQLEQLISLERDFQCANHALSEGYRRSF